MKKSNFLLAGALSLSTLFFLSFTFTGGTNPVAYNVDTKASSIAWKAFKVTGEHAGLVDVKVGSVQFTDGKLSGGSFEIDMTSIQVTDLQGGMKGKLEGHLKSDDFFGANNYPVAKFVITKVTSKGTAGNYKVVGDLTIKSTTKEIRFDANVVESGGQITATGNIKIDRSEYDVRYGSGSFFDNLGDKTIYDDFDLSVKLVASK